MIESIFNIFLGLRESKIKITLFWSIVIVGAILIFYSLIKYAFGRMRKSHPVATYTGLFVLLVIFVLVGLYVELSVEKFIIRNSIIVLGLIVFVIPIIVHIITKKKNKKNSKSWILFSTIGLLIIGFGIYAKYSDRANKILFNEYLEESDDVFDKKHDNEETIYYDKKGNAFNYKLTVNGMVFIFNNEKYEDINDEILKSKLFSVPEYEKVLLEDYYAAVSSYESAKSKLDEMNIDYEEGEEE